MFTCYTLIYLINHSEQSVSCQRVYPLVSEAHCGFTSFTNMLSPYLESCQPAAGIVVVADLLLGGDAAGPVLDVVNPDLVIPAHSHDGVPGHR